MKTFIDTRVDLAGKKYIRRHFASVQECRTAEKEHAGHIITALPTVLILDSSVSLKQTVFENRRDETLILLAGGKSSRMGTNKALKDFFGTTMLQFQLETAELAGFQTIMLSAGMNTYYAPGVSCISDDIEDRGPLGGIVSCMKRANTRRCIVLPVDVPMLSADILVRLAEHSDNNPILVLRHDGKSEPLISRWNTELFGQINAMISKKGISVQRAIEQIGNGYLDCEASESVFMNLNTPEAYQYIIKAVPEFE